MGCDIHVFVEIRRDGRWRRAFDGSWEVEGDDHVFGRSYHLFGFLADVRNRSLSPVIAPPRGFPDDVSPSIRDAYEDFGHTPSWVTAAELLAYDYDEAFRDYRDEALNKVMRERVDRYWWWAGRDRMIELAAEHYDLEKIALVRLRDHLPTWYFTELTYLARLGDPEDVRIVFFFDN